MLLDHQVRLYYTYVIYLKYTNNNNLLILYVHIGLASAAQNQGRRVADLLFKSLAKPTYSPLSSRTLITEAEVDVDTEKADFETPHHEDHNSPLFSSVPLTLWTIPEAASVGMSKPQALARFSRGPTDDIYYEQYAYIEGYAYFKDMARGRLSGDLDGRGTLVICASIYLYTYPTLTVWCIIRMLWCCMYVYT